MPNYVLIRTSPSTAPLLYTEKIKPPNLDTPLEIVPIFPDKLAASLFADGTPGLVPTKINIPTIRIHPENPATRPK